MNNLIRLFSSGKTKTIEWRLWQLKQLWWLVEENEQFILDALAQDLGRHELESTFGNLMSLKENILNHIKHVQKWAIPEPVKGAGFLFGTLGGAHVRKKPLGVVLIIEAWNFPFLLTFQPVAAAIFAGSCVIIKPSELASSSEKLIVELVNRYLDRSAIRIATGGPQKTTKFLKHRFDHIFFTGSTKVGKIVAAAAAKHLTPTVLELGGQNPAIVTKNANVDLAAKRIANVKFLNAGQICLSVNQVFVDSSVHGQFINSLKRWTTEFESSGQMYKVINKRNFDRLSGLLEKTEGDVVCGGWGSRKTGTLPGTVVDNVTMSDSLMSEELFGPICPVLTATIDEAIDPINSLPHPLALYIFSNDQQEIKSIQNQTTSGGITINHCMMHAGVPNVPFGGVGASGMGRYHGKYGFDAFTHLRTVVAPPTWLELVLSVRYPPFDGRKVGWFAVKKNRLGFRRGETMADQKAGGFKVGCGCLWRVFAWAVVLACGLYGIDNVRAAQMMVPGWARVLMGAEL